MDNNTTDGHAEEPRYTGNRPDRAKNIFLIILAFVMSAAVAAFLSMKKCSPDLLPNNLNEETTTEETATQEIDAKNLAAEEAIQKLAEQRKLQELEANKALTPPLPIPQETVAPPVDPNSPSGISQQFINTIIKLDPVAAKNYVAAPNVSYATLAGLCMIFEDGNYQLIEDRAIRKMFLKENTAGYLVQVQEAVALSKASFALNIKRENAQSPWLITEINLDGLLSHYSTQVSGGDIHYSPLIKNLQGGDSLAIYFELDSNTLTQRTQKQLRIVNRLLKADPSKNLVISGHTDALGSDNYNLALSETRAQQVRDFLVINGLNKSQVSITGFGKNQPIQPNTRKDGADSPEGRRANRRAEILLDF